MREGIHPDYRKVVFMDTTSGFKFLSGSTKPSKETIEWEDGNTYPLLSNVSTKNTVSSKKNKTDISFRIVCFYSIYYV